MLIKVTAALEDSITNQKPIFVVIGLRLAWYHISRRLRNRLINPPECGKLCPASSTGFIHLAHLGPIAVHSTKSVFNSQRINLADRPRI
jgi:hypothetical protein